MSQAGVRVVICTNQPEVARRVINRRQLDAIHQSLCRQLARNGACIDLILCGTADDRRSAARKPAPGMLLDAMQRFGAKPADTPFVGDQRDDLEAAANAHCLRVLVRSGNGRATEKKGFPNTVGIPTPRRTAPLHVAKDTRLPMMVAASAPLRERDRERAVRRGVQTGNKTSAGAVDGMNLRRTHAPSPSSARARVRAAQSRRLG